VASLEETGTEFLAQIQLARDCANESVDDDKGIRDVELARP
jgi:hypothetical protein